MKGGIIVTDIFTKTKRSEIMSKIQSKDTKPEEIVRKYLFSKGFRYRKNDKKLSGTPDIVLSKYKKVIFVNGCFWHGHKGCKYSKLPQTRQSFWKNKIYQNIDRDKRNLKRLNEEGWNTIIVWECDLRNKFCLEKRLKKLEKEIIC